MRLTVLYPANRQDAADLLKPAISPVTHLEVTWASCEPDSFTSDLGEVCEDDSPLVILLDHALLAEMKGMARTIWAPVLRRIENGAASTVGLVRLDAVTLPPLIQKLRVAQKYECRREVLRWIMSWMHIEPTALEKPHPDSTAWLEDALQDLYQGLVDLPGQLHARVTGTASQRHAAIAIAHQLWPYFEYVDWLEAHHESPALRQAELERRRTSGRGLTIISGVCAAGLPRSSSGSILSLSPDGDFELPVPSLPDLGLNALQLAQAWLPAIPKGSGGALPFPTWQFESVLFDLFTTNWVIADKLARRTGAYLRDNHRVAEAIWLYEQFLDQATGHRDTAAIQTCEDELYWLRAGGVRKQQLLSADQGSLF